MSDIQRWWPDIEGRGVLRPVMRPIPDDFHPDDEYVTYADHVEALRQAEQRGAREATSPTGISLWQMGHEQGQRDAIAAAEQRGYLQGQEDSATQFQYGVEQGQRDAIAAAVQRVEALATERELKSPSDISVDLRDAIAAIKGDSDA